MSGVPEATLGSDALLKGLTGPSKTVISQLQIITANEYRLKSVKKKIIHRGSPGKTRWQLPVVSREVPGTALNPPGNDK